MTRIYVGVTDVINKLEWIIVRFNHNDVGSIPLVPERWATPAISGTLGDMGSGKTTPGFDAENPAFNAEEKEQALRAESDSWDTTTSVAAREGDVPVVDVAAYFASGALSDLAEAADSLRNASETVGFHQLIGHGVSRQAIDEIFDFTRRFHALPLDLKLTIRMDRPDWPLAGSGYLPVGERKLPRREVGNANEAFLVKSDRGVGFDQNQWLAEHELPGFRDAVERYSATVTDLALRLLPIYAVALDLPPDFFAEGFTHPFSRLRLSHYPPAQPRREGDAYGIAPHVDTTFFTLLLQGGPGLTIYSHERDQWISVPVVDDAYVVNSGELLRQWSNDRFLSTRHYAHNTSAHNTSAHNTSAHNTSAHNDSADRYSIPFFFNATSDYPMECLPSCHGPDNPPKYPTISYNQSQGVVQGE